VIFKREKERNLKTCIQIPKRGERGKNTMHLNSRIPNNQIPEFARLRGQIRLLLANFFGEVRVFEVGIFVVKDVDGEAAGGVVCIAPDLAGDLKVAWSWGLLKEKSLPVVILPTTVRYFFFKWRSFSTSWFERRRIRE
jgi:hypothetical protein